MRTKKIRTNITIDKNLLDEAKKFGISISGFIDIELRRYIALLRGKYIYNSYNDGQSSGRTTQGKGSVGLLRFA